jgi:hypothetical protein
MRAADAERGKSRSGLANGWWCLKFGWRAEHTDERSAGGYDWASLCTCPTTRLLDSGLYSCNYITNP